MRLLGISIGLSVLGSRNVFQGRPAVAIAAAGARLWVSNNAGLVEVAHELSRLAQHASEVCLLATQTFE